MAPKENDDKTAQPAKPQEPNTAQTAETQETKDQADQIQKNVVADLRTPGFLLAIGDPFAAGTLRTFMSVSKRSGLQLPFVLPFKDKNSAAAIRGYIVRAEGGGDLERAKLAKEALAKCKKK